MRENGPISHEPRPSASFQPTPAGLDGSGQRLSPPKKVDLLFREHLGRAERMFDGWGKRLGPL